MYLAARSWGIQPSEFWAMSIAEWLLEADFHWRGTTEGRHDAKRGEWMAQMEMTDEEWWARHGTS